MRFWKWPFFVAIGALVASCASPVARWESMEIAERYANVRWMPEKRHILHGRDSAGVMVCTPDSSQKATGMWWKPGELAKGMPYQWGGFDTPDSFLQAITNGKKAGDIANSEKRRQGDAGTSKDCCGIDCSGLVSRCWKLPRPYSTKELPSICTRVNWSELKPGDILLNDKHVVVFAGINKSDGKLIGYEAGMYPWRVNRTAHFQWFYQKHGYQPWKYTQMPD